MGGGVVEVASCDGEEGVDEERARSEPGRRHASVKTAGAVVAVGAVEAGGASSRTSLHSSVEADAAEAGGASSLPSSAEAVGEMHAGRASSLESGSGSSEVEETSEGGASYAMGECGTLAFHKRTGMETGKNVRKTETFRIFLARESAGGSASASVADVTGSIARSAGTELCGMSAADIVEGCRFCGFVQISTPRKLIFSNSILKNDVLSKI